ncbi:MAG: hypothetical protein Q8M26_12780 [Pseudolabrys sp.]|nr:hypothetical protein [Pseudolabrys sp.]
METVDYRSNQSAVGSVQDHPDDAPLILMTPARRAALEALEREFHDLLQMPPR